LLADLLRDRDPAVLWNGAMIPLHVRVDPPAVHRKLPLLLRSPFSTAPIDAPVT